MLPRLTLTTLMFLIALSVAAEDVKTPQELFAGRATRVDDIPEGWATTKPILLRVCYNLKYPVNSPEANAFLREKYRTITGLEFGVQLRIERNIHPAEFAYCSSLVFRNWEVHRRYETSDTFLRYYREQWKPAVTEAKEYLSVLDDVAGAD